MVRASLANVRFPPIATGERTLLDVSKTPDTCAIEAMKAGTTPSYLCATNWLARAPHPQEYVHSSRLVYFSCGSTRTNFIGALQVSQTGAWITVCVEGGGVGL